MTPTNKIHRAEKERLIICLEYPFSFMGGFRLTTDRAENKSFLFLQGEKMDTKFIKTKKEKNYTVLDNTFIKDTRLSWKAKGLMTYLLSLPDDWTIHLSEIEKHASDGKSALRSAINELKEFGYLKAEQKRENNRFAEMVYIIIENPDFPLTDFQQTENLQTENLNSENQTLQNTNNDKVLNKQSTDNNIPKEKKHKNGTYQNVLLSASELKKLCDTLGPDKAEAVIDNFSELKEMKGYKYKSDYLAIKNWGIEAYEKKTSQNNGYVNNKRPASDNKVGEIDF